MRIDKIIEGLSTGLNQEKLINELYGYIQKNEENAFYVSNTLRKALLTESLIACTIMGRMIAFHVSDDTEYTMQDKIIYHALENATDEDILFIWNLRKYISEDESCFRIPTEIIEDTESYSSIQWGVYNRIIDGTEAFMYETIDGNFTVESDNTIDSFCPNCVYTKLIEYIESVKQILRWQ